jgi:molybdopterin converting factor small subunit
MQVDVLLFSSLSDKLGFRRLTIDCEPQEDVYMLWQRIAQEPSLQYVRVLCAVNQDYVPLDYVLHDHDEVAFFPAGR